MEREKAPEDNHSEVEFIKYRSNFLRGTLVEGLQDRITGAVASDDTQLTKFHGIYQQDDRDVRRERKKQKLEPAFMFMIRVRVPGGICTAKQYLEMDEIANTLANHTIKLTTRQAYQFHGILKHNLKQAMQEINASLLDTIAACGDVNRNVMCNAIPLQSEIHEDLFELSKEISDHLTPQTNAYHEIWMDGEKVSSSEVEEEPIYGKTYLPRKFKIGLIVPPQNDADVFTQDLGYIAIEQKGKLIGYNVTVGGGMGTTHSVPETYPRLGDLLGFCTPEQAVEVAEAVVTTQRDFGNRVNRKNARLKYTVDRMTLDGFRDEVESRLKYKLQKAKPFKLTTNGDIFGWTEDVTGAWHYTLFVEGGRVQDTKEYKLMTGLREIAKMHKGDFRLTGNQNLVIGNVTKTDKVKIQKLLDKHGMEANNQQSGTRLHGIACVALGTCGLAMAESERYLPSLMDKIDVILKDAGLFDDKINIRMTGCPNGCGRPFMGEIGFIGKGPGSYNMYLGASHNGDRLNKLFKENVKEPEILEILGAMLPEYAKKRKKGESFGDWVIRAGHIKATTHGTNFHD